MCYRLKVLGISLALWSVPSILQAACSGPVGGAPGNCAPDFHLKDLNGKEIRLSQFRGKVVALNLWASWCAPCATEIPSMQEAVRRMPQKDFVMLAVSADSDGKKAVAPFLEKMLGASGPLFTVLLDPSQAVTKRFGTFKFPETYI